MATLADIIRRFWLPGLNNVTQVSTLTDLRQWIARQEFQVYSPLDYPFPINYSEPELLCEAFAGEVLRMSLAAAESVASIQPVPRLPKSKAWAIIQWYYAAFYSAHAILRMCGSTLVQLEAGQVRDIANVAGLFSQPCHALSGFHCLVVDATNRQLVFNRMTGNGGSHEFLWDVFQNWLANVSRQLLSAGQASHDIQTASDHLDKLRMILNNSPAQRGSWLSHVRNRVNYRHELSAWFPYEDHDDLDLCLFVQADRALSPADTITLPSSVAVRPIQAFFAACRFLVSLCNDLAVEMATRSPRGASFHKQGILHLRNLIDQPRPPVRGGRSRKAPA